MPITIELDKDLAIDALEVAAAQRSRAKLKFKPGSAAYSEMDSDAAKLNNAINKLKTEPTPLEESINKRK